MEKIIVATTEGPLSNTIMYKKGLVRGLEQRKCPTNVVFVFLLLVSVMANLMVGTSRKLSEIIKFPAGSC